jgi:hypothetical protein
MRTWTVMRTRTPLQTAAERGDAAAVRALLSAAVAPGGGGGGGQKPLLESRTQGYEATPLHLSASQGHAAVVDALLQAGADVHSRRSGGFTALHLAANTAVARLLLERGVDVTSRSNEGLTATESCLGGGAVQAFIAAYHRRQRGLVRGAQAGRQHRPVLSECRGAQVNVAAGQKAPSMSPTPPQQPILRLSPASAIEGGENPSKNVCFSPHPPVVVPLVVSERERQEKAAQRVSRRAARRAEAKQARERAAAAAAAITTPGTQQLQLQVETDPKKLASGAAGFVDATEESEAGVKASYSHSSPDQQRCASNVGHGYYNTAVRPVLPPLGLS